jgi:hypothetical protein
MKKLIIFSIVVLGAASLYTGYVYNHNDEITPTPKELKEKTLGYYILKSNITRTC